MMETIAALEEAGGWSDDHETSLACFLAARLSVTSGKAWELVHMARSLRELPAIWEAHSEGRISLEQLRPLTRFATPETDEALAREVPGMRIGRLWREAHRHERRRRQREMKSDRQLRSLRKRWDEEKRFLHVELDLAAEDGAVFEESVERRAREIVLDDSDEPFDRQGARLADAVVDLVSSSGDKTTPATLVIHAAASVLTGVGTSALAETESGVQVTDEAVRRIACDARVEWVLEADGRAVGIGRLGRFAPGWMTRQLVFRDPECRFDGCTLSRNLIAHHIVPWSRGGPTDMDNLVRLCRAHHRLVHEGGWRIRGHPDRGLTFERPPDRHRSRRSLPKLVAASFP
jgi:hypothetical protein